MTDERKALIERVIDKMLQAPVFMGCGHQLTESESDYYDNRRHLPRLCKRCVLEERAR